VSQVAVFDVASDHSPTNVPLLAGSSGLPPKPDLSLGYLPARSSSIVFEGALLDYLPVQASCKGVHCNATLNAQGAVLGLIDPAGNQQASIDYSAFYGQLIATLMINPEAAVAQGSTLIEEDYWKLLFSVVIPANTPFDSEQAVTSGITETDSTTFSYTVGVTKPKGINASLTKSFEHTVSVTTQETTTHKFQWPQRLTEATVGVYQLMQAFWVQPGSNLTAAISQMNLTLGCAPLPYNLPPFCLRFGSDAKFAYPTSTYLQAATTPPRINTLGVDEIRRFIDSSISVSPIA
jgi:hypothetical protein